MLTGNPLVLRESIILIDRFWYSVCGCCVHCCAHRFFRVRALILKHSKDCAFRRLLLALPATLLCASECLANVLPRIRAVSMCEIRP